MRLFLRATRALIGYATTAHIATLRGAVKLTDRKVAKAQRRTDAAVVAVMGAQQNLDYAKVHRNEVRDAEDEARLDARAFYRAAQAEAKSLRRGVTI